MNIHSATAVPAVNTPKFLDTPCRKIPTANDTGTVIPHRRLRQDESQQQVATGECPLAGLAMAWLDLLAGQCDLPAEGRISIDPNMQLQRWRTGVEADHQRNRHADLETAACYPRTTMRGSSRTEPAPSKTRLRRVASGVCAEPSPAWERKSQTVEVLSKSGRGHSDPGKPIPQPRRQPVVKHQRKPEVIPFLCLASPIPQIRN